jgi:hypothetical protein
MAQLWAELIVTQTLFEPATRTDEFCGFMEKGELNRQESELPASVNPEVQEFHVFPPLIVLFIAR